MKGNTKIILILIGAMVFIGLSGCTNNGGININPAQISNIRSDIADFDLPPGYSADFCTSLIGYTMIAYSNGNGPSHIYLIQSEKETDGEKLAQILSELVVGSGDPETQMTVIETRLVHVRGEETTLVISDWINSEGTTYRQAAAAFQGYGGPALIVFSESIENWNQVTLNTLLASVH